MPESVCCELYSACTGWAAAAKQEAAAWGPVATSGGKANSQFRSSWVAVRCASAVALQD